MVFSGLIFIYVFLPVSLLLYYLSPRISARNFILMILSVIFYSWGEPLWVCLLIVSTAAAFLLGQVIEKYRGAHLSKLALIASVTISLGLLAVFKYSGLIVSSINDVFGLKLTVPSFSLPIGISFYTFQTLSYTVDVYWGNTKAQRSFVDFLLFVSLFPQLIAGPILRYSDIEAQLPQREHSFDKFARGIQRFVIGMGKKIIIANHAGELAGQFLTPGGTVLGIWFGLLMFTIQIYFDFSGYSDMAIGLGRMFGFEYKENFIYPYCSLSVTDFWRRWHISLSTFFRDYVYIPLGGNRRRQLRNIMIVWGLTGIWHGASWNFALWGLYYGFILIMEKLFLLKALKHVPKPISWCYAMFVTMIGWAIFYFTDMNQLWAALGVMFGQAAEATGFAVNQAIRHNLVFILAAAAAATALPAKMATAVVRSFGGLAGKLGGFAGPNLVMAGTICFDLAIIYVCTSLLNSSSYNPFLYFRF